VALHNMPFLIKEGYVRR